MTLCFVTCEPVIMLSLVFFFIHDHKAHIQHVITGLIYQLMQTIYTSQLNLNSTNHQTPKIANVIPRSNGSRLKFCIQFWDVKQCQL